MSGKLVGEVLDAAGNLKQAGLSERGFHALVAIAEKCHSQTREGSVRWDHIRAGLYGASLSTAKRAVADLKSAGVVRVLKRGFDNHAGKSHAPIYRIEPLGERVTQVSHSPPSPTGHSGDTFAPTERLTQVNHSPRGERVKSGGRTGQIGGRTGHPGDPLDGSLDGSLDGVVAADPAADSEPPPEPSRFCPKHPNNTNQKCRPCGWQREEHQRWQNDKAERDRQAAQNRFSARQECKQCGGGFWVIGSDGAPVEPARPCPVCKPAMSRAP